MAPLGEHPREHEVYWRHKLRLQHERGTSVPATTSDRHNVAMSSTPPEKKYPVVQFKKWMLVLGPRFWVAVVVAGLIIIIGFATNPTNPDVGVWVAVSTILGTVLGVILQVLPVPDDHSERSAGAVRGLATTADTLQNASVMLDRVASETREQRTQTGLAAVQGNIVAAVNQIQIAMLDWDQIAPGVVEAHVADRSRGREILERMSRELGTDG